MQCGHPTNKSLWAIGYKNQIGFIGLITHSLTKSYSLTYLPTHPLTHLLDNEFIYGGVSSTEYQYNKLPFHIDIPSSEGVVTDFLFNDIGTVLLVVLRNNHGSTIHFYDLPDFNKVPYITYSLTHLLTHSLTYLLTYLLAYLLTHSLTHSPTYSLTHSPT